MCACFLRACTGISAKFCKHVRGRGMCSFVGFTNQLLRVCFFLYIYIKGARLVANLALKAPSPTTLRATAGTPKRLTQVWHPFPPPLPPSPLALISYFFFCCCYHYYCCLYSTPIHYAGRRYAQPFSGRKAASHSRLLSASHPTRRGESRGERFCGEQAFFARLTYRTTATLIHSILSSIQPPAFILPPSSKPGSSSSSSATSALSSKAASAFPISTATAAPARNVDDRGFEWDGERTLLPTTVGLVGEDVIALMWLLPSDTSISFKVLGNCLNVKSIQVRAGHTVVLGTLSVARHWLFSSSLCLLPFFCSSRFVLFTVLCTDAATAARNPHANVRLL